jgi:hypothetical protein
MDLPEELEKQFQIELKAFEEARQMKYVTTIERMAEERGAKSREVEIALNLLSLRFGDRVDRPSYGINDRRDTGSPSPANVAFLDNALNAIAHPRLGDRTSSKTDP